MYPTLDLDTDSYIKIIMPKTLEFQGPSCTVSEHKGFSQQISCTRYGHEMTLFNPFDVPLRADVAERLEMTIEEFLMPTAVQDIGVIQVITYDKREGVFRAIDQINFDNLVTRSGALTKLQDVQVTSTMTGRTDQTYTFNFQAQHKVPLNGFFSIIISETASKGVMITDAETVEKNCNLIEGTTAKGLECKTGQT